MAQARHRATNVAVGPDELIEILWNSFKPCARKIRNLIMQNNPPPRYPPGLEPWSIRTKVPSLATRRAACTHLTMDRLYGNFRCNVCHRASELGWVYTCNQDDEADTIEAFESLTEHATDSDDIPPSVIRSDSQRVGKESSLLTTQLNPWVERAIAEGHYNEKQVAILRAQKQKVFDTATAAVEAFEQSQDEMHLPLQPATTSQSLDANPHLPFPVLHELQETSTMDPSLGKGSSEVPRLQMFPHCKFRACQLCRPTYRDRTWLCFDEIFEKPMPIPAQALGDENRPMASLSLMCHIGLRELPHRLPRPQLRAFDSRVLYDFDDAGKIFFKARSSNRTAPDTVGHSGDVADATVEPESRGFRESMKRAFKGMLAARQTSTRSGVGRRRMRESTTSDEDAAEFDMGLWQEMNDELLNEASSVPLPLNDSVETDQVDEVDIGGVAVTEEAADLKAADVIMSV